LVFEWQQEFAYQKRMMSLNCLDRETFYHPMEKCKSALLPLLGLKALSVEEEVGPVVGDGSLVSHMDPDQFECGYDLHERCTHSLSPVEFLETDVASDSPLYTSGHRFLLNQRTGCQLDRQSQTFVQNCRHDSLDNLTRGQSSIHKAFLCKRIQSLEAVCSLGSPLRVFRPKNPVK